MNSRIDMIICFVNIIYKINITFYLLFMISIVIYLNIMAHTSLTKIVFDDSLIIWPIFKLLWGFIAIYFYFKAFTIFSRRNPKNSNTPKTKRSHYLCFFSSMVGEHTFPHWGGILFYAINTSLIPILGPAMFGNLLQNFAMNSIITPKTIKFSLKTIEFFLRATAQQIANFSQLSILVFYA